MQPVIYIGIDISKARLDVAASSPTARQSYPNNRPGIARLFVWMRAQRPSFVVFEAGAYFDRLGLGLPAPKFLDQVVIRFGIADTAAHYHVPLLLSPYGYSTYRGS